MLRSLFFIEGMNIGGQQTFMYNLFRHLELADHELHTAYVFDGTMLPQYQSISHKTHKIGWPYDPFDLFKDKRTVIRIIFDLIRVIRSNRISLVFSNGFCSFFTASYASWLTGVKHARFIGGDLTKNEPFHFNSWRYHLFPPHQLTSKYFGSQFVLSKMLEKGVKREKLLPLFQPGAVDTKLFAPKLSKREKYKLKNILGIKEQDFVIGWAGRIEKNLELRNTYELVCTLIDNGYKNFKLLLIGNGAWLSDLLQDAKNRGVRNNILHLDFVTPDELGKYIELMDIVPLLDVNPIGGSKIREAMACGTVPMTVDGISKEQRRLIKNETTGLLLMPNDFIRQAVDLCIKYNKNRRDLCVIGKAARQFAVDNMDFQVIADRLSHEISLLTARK